MFPSFTQDLDDAKRQTMAPRRALRFYCLGSSSLRRSSEVHVIVVAVVVVSVVVAVVVVVAVLVVVVLVNVLIRRT